MDPVERANSQRVTMAVRLKMHTSRCKVCALDYDLRSEIDRMLLDGATMPAVVDFCKMLGIYMSLGNIEVHRKFLNYIATDDAISSVVEQWKMDGSILGEAMKTKEEKIACRSISIQEAKAELLEGLWTDTLTSLKEAVDKIKGNPLLPAKDLSSAFETMLKSAMLLEGKPTSILKAEMEGNPGLSDLEKLDLLLGGMVVAKPAE